MRESRRCSQVIMFLDADDVFYPDHLARIYAPLEADPSIAFFKTPMDFTVPVHPEWQVPIQLLPGDSHIVLCASLVHRLCAYAYACECVKRIPSIPARYVVLLPFPCGYLKSAFLCILPDRSFLS